MDRRQFLAAAAGGITGVVASARIASANNESGATPNGAKPAAKTAKKPVPADLSDYVWHNVREWGVEGRGFDDTENYYDRLPARAKGIVREEVWNLARHSTGMAAFFETEATDIAIRYSVLNALLAMPHMPATGVSGVDLYANTDRGWRWVATHKPSAQTMEAKLVARLAPGKRAYHVNLPLYNGVTSMEIGVPKTASFTPTPPRKDKPVLFYGTSITQGGCASRPGMCFTSILRRRLNRPVLNFGFSGNGKTEVEVGRFLAELDPAVFVLDTLANTGAEILRERMEALVKVIREKRPSTPILLLDERTIENAPLVPAVATAHEKKFEALKQAYDNLVAAGVKDLHLRKCDDVLGNDQEGTVDGSHPTDLGMMRYADAIEPDIRKLLPSA
jgi:lysophospholipase L1-like esterase